VTVYETTGWRGVMERPSGSLDPARFWSLPSGVFPLYHVLADVADCAGGTLTGLHDAEARTTPRVVAAVVERGHVRRLLLANLTSMSQEVSWEGFGDATCVRRLTAGTAVHASNEPESFRASRDGWTGGTRLQLDAYEYARVDLDGRRTAGLSAP
jgi:hypothetical protein